MLGGKLYTIPVSRLPRHVIDCDIQWAVETAGANLVISTNREILDPSFLLSEGFSCVFEHLFGYNYELFVILPVCRRI